MPCIDYMLGYEDSDRSITDWRAGAGRCTPLYLWQKEHSSIIPSIEEFVAQRIRLGILKVQPCVGTTPPHFHYD